MQCKNCGVESDADGKFCKECGQKLDQSANTVGIQQDDHVRIGELIYTAYKNKEAGRIEDAILACQGALALNGASASAHSLLGTLYETKGDITAAIREYERVLELAPESQTERQKLDDLRLGKVSPEMFAVNDKPVDGMKQHMPLFIAGGIFLVMLLVLSLVFLKPSSTNSKDKEEIVGQPINVDPVYGNIPPGQYPYQQQPGQYPQQPGQVGQQGATGQNTSQPQQNTPATQPAGTIVSKPPTQTTGRAPGNRIAPTDLAVRPINTSSPVNTTPQPVNSNPVIVPVIPSTGAPTAMRPVSPPIIRTTPQPAADPETRALNLQSQGKYQDAVGAYREALGKTSDHGRIYQSMALCYQRLGQKDQAVDSYTRAIKSYRDQLAAGRDAAEVQRNIRACEAGIQVNKN